MNNSTRPEYFRLSDFTVGYDGLPLISDISLSIERGKILTLIGPNGSGKSTILKTITKHLSKLSGVVYIDGRDTMALSNKEMARTVSVVLTDRIHPELMTCEDVVATGRYPYTNCMGRLTPLDAKVVAEALEKVKASDLRYKSFCTLSDGQRQRIMLARAICQQADVIVLDEPTSFLDIRHRIELLEILRHMAVCDKVTIIMSLHEIDIAAKVSDYILCVKGEHIYGFGAPEEVFTQDIVQDLYDIPKGSYDVLLNDVELSKVSGDPAFFVIAGAGRGIPFYRALRRKELAFSTGILHENDVDYQVASSLATHISSQRPFEAITRDTYEEAKDEMLKIGRVIDASPPIGEFNVANRYLLDEAVERGLTILHSVSDV